MPPTTTTRVFPIDALNKPVAFYGILGPFQSIPSPTRLPFRMDPIESSRDDVPHFNPAEPSSNAKVSKRKKAPVRERLSDPILLELWSIWRANPRVPSIKSRRAWANSRNTPPRLVNSWFLRRRTTAKKAGETVLEGPYELSVESRIVSEPPKPKTERCSPVPFDLPSDDTLGYPDGDELDRLEASSDTVWDDCANTDTKVIKTHAYTEVFPKEDCDLPQKSSDDDHAPEDVPDEDTLTIVSYDLLLPVCNRGRGKKSDGFTCILCSKKPLKGIPKKNLGDTSTISCLTGDSHIAIPHLVRLEVLPDTPMELSAIPFLFRTPTSLASENFGNRDMDSWMILEDELGQLVREGKLDFSFLDVPDLTSMELLN